MWESTGIKESTENQLRINWESTKIWVEIHMKESTGNQKNQGNHTTIIVSDLHCNESLPGRVKTSAGVVKLRLLLG